MKKISAGGKIFIAAGLILLAAVAQHFIFNVLGVGDGRALVMTDTGKSVTYDINESAQFYSYDDAAFYFCTKDGIEYISAGGESVWKEIFSLTNPNMVTAGETVAVGDAMGKHIYVFNADGPVYDVELPYPALTFSVNRTGYLSVILQMESGYTANIYNERNNAVPLAFYELHDPQKHPVAMDVSEDGRYTVIATWNFDIRFASRVMFYYINESDALSTADPMGMFAAQDYDGQAILTVRCMSESRALVFSDTQIACFQPGEANSCPEIWNIPIHNEIIARPSFYGGDGFALALGDGLLNDPGAAESGGVHIYNADGEQTGVFNLGLEATSLTMGNGGLLVGAGRRFYALSKTGERLWDYTAAFDSQGVYFLGNTDTVLVAGNAGAQIMKREKETPSTEEPEGDLQVEPD